MKDEIVIVRLWRWVWWDVEAGTEYRQAITGSYPRLEYRRIEDTWGKKLHSLDLGEIKPNWSTRWEGTISYTTIWDECSTCGKKFNERAI